VDFPKGFTLQPDLKAQNDQLAQKYGVKGYPTVIVCNPSGTVVGNLGYMEGGSPAFIAELSKIVKR
jgi:protein-disulfide isomerase